ncbi:MAG: hypothetical protein AB3N14_15265 [Flavobacteriaceae bacterium]
MLINAKEKSNKNSIVLFALLALMALLVFKLFSSGKDDNTSEAFSLTEKNDPGGDPTKLNASIFTEDLISGGKNKVFERDNFSLFFNNELGTPTFMAVYSGSITDLELNGRFLALLHLKDPKEWLAVNKRRKHITLAKETIAPYQRIVNDTLRYIFKFRLEHPYFDMDNLKEVEFIRHSRVLGRFEEVKLQPHELGAYEAVSNGLESLRIVVSEKNLNKIRAKRNDALKSGILVTEDSDLVKATVSGDGKKDIPADIRLKGDLPDHLVHAYKWSYRIVPKGDNTVFGMRKFSIQHPKSRNYLWEWLFNKVVKDNDLVGLRYEFLNVNLDVKNKNEGVHMGIMALEESFDKILIENNRRREGLILGLDESIIWDKRKQVKELQLDYPKDVERTDATELPVKVYNENKTLSSPVLSRQFEIAKNLVIGLRDTELQLSEAFDTDKLAMYIALSNLFGGHHGLHIENFRMYYNPVTNKLEPVSFDSNSGHKIKFLREYPIGRHDAAFRKKLVEKYALVSSEAFVNDIISKYAEDLDRLSGAFSSEFKDATMNLEILEYNANQIKKKILPANSISATFLSQEKNKMTLEIKNVSDFPVIIEDLVLSNKKSLNENHAELVVLPKDTITYDFQLKPSFNNAFVSKKNKEGGFRYPKDLSKIELSHRIAGIPNNSYQHIIAFDSNLDLNIVRNTQPTPNFDQFDFINIDPETRELHFKAGDYTLDELLFIPENYTIKVAPGFRLNLINKASLVSYSSFQCNGTPERPIEIYSEDSSGGGLFISSAKEASTVSHTYFTNLSIPKIAHWELSGAVNFNETIVHIKQATFEKNRSEDALNIIRSTFSLDAVEFKDTYSDAFDGDFVKGTISNSNFTNAGNDGIDVSGSDIEVMNVKVINPADKGISAGEGSTINGRNVEIREGEIGLVSKDLSRINMEDIAILDTRLGISCFQKKTEYGPGIIDLKDVSFSGIEVAYLIAPTSDLIIDNKIIQEKTEGVIDKMYGSEYGKSSR